MEIILELETVDEHREEIFALLDDFTEELWKKQLVDRADYGVRKE